MMRGKIMSSTNRRNKQMTAGRMKEESLLSNKRFIIVNDLEEMMCARLRSKMKRSSLESL